MPRPISVQIWREFETETDVVPSEAGPRQASVLQNLYRNLGTLGRRKGTSPLGAGNLSPNQDLDGLAWYKIGSTEYIVSPHNGRLYDWQAAAEVTNSSGKLTSGTDANGAWVDGKFYWGDGVKQNIRHDGTNAAQVLTQAPSTAPTVAVGAATGPTGTFTYYVTFSSDDGNASELSPKSAAVTVTNQKISLTSIPTCPAGQDCEARILWRNKNGTTVYYLVTIIADNTTTTYTDETTDANLGAPLTDALGANHQNKRFPPTRFLIPHQNRLVGAFCTTADGDKQTVYLSNYRQPWYCPLVPDLEDPNQGSRFPLQGPGAGEITGLASHGTHIAVFTADAAWLLTTSDQLLDYTLHRFSNHGCVAHRTIVSVKDTLIWFSDDGVYMAREGQGVQLISKDKQATIDAISTADKAKAHAFHWNDKYFLCWPSGAIVYDLTYGIWSTNTAWLWRASTVSVFSSAAVEKIYAAQNGSARVWQLETGSNDNGSAISTVWASADVDLGLPGREKRIHFFYTEWKTGSGTATMRLYKGTGTTEVQNATKDLSVVDDTGATVVRLEQRAKEQARSTRFRLRVEYSGSASEYVICETGLLWSWGT